MNHVYVCLLSEFCPVLRESANGAYIGDFFRPVMKSNNSLKKSKYKKWLNFDCQKFQKNLKYLA